MKKKLRPVLKREAAFRELEKLVGLRESGANNRGKGVDAITRADTLPGIGYAWCQALQNFAWRRANGEYLAGGTASVGKFVEWARDRAYVLRDSEVPRKWDHITFLFDGDSWADHVGMIARVIKAGPVLYLVTIEGNTGPTGSVSDPGTGRDGVYKKRRVVRRSRCRIIRVRGYCRNAKRYQ